MTSAASRCTGPRHRLRAFLSRIGVRLLAFHVILVFLPAAGFLYLDTFERKLLEAQETSMVQQGRLLGAALGGSGEINEKRAQEIVGRLSGRVTARLRVVDREARVVADTSRWSSASNEQSQESLVDEPTTRVAPLYRVGAFLYRVFERLSPPRSTPHPVEPVAPGEPLLVPPVEAALAGRYGASTLLSPGQRSVTLFSAIPVRSDDEVVGAVVVSRSTFRILGDLYDVRLSIFRVVLASVLVAVVVSVLFTATIVRPLTLLRRDASHLLDHQGRLRGRFRGSSRQDEIGELSRALEVLSRRLGERLDAIESFASDVAHELRNPLASLRTATEMLSESAEPAVREKLLHQALSELARLERMLSDLLEMARMDSHLEEEDQTPTELTKLVRDVARGFAARARSEVTVNTTPGSPENLVVRASPHRLVQVLENLLDNATSFAPPGTAVTVGLARLDESAIITVRDQGPGIPEGDREKVFRRFFTARPEGQARHTGLGLAIARAIVGSYGGTLVVADHPGPGAAMVVTLPLSSPER